ncbi:hypothetical protein G424_01460 [Acinetobacter baumannii PR07]|nr:hypothetical protein G424_01460 [Acinetobacter baumannii PR07]
MISQTLNQRKSKKSVVTRGPKQSSLFSFVGKLLCSGMKAIKTRYAVIHIGLNQSIIKAGDALIMIFFELLYSY